MQSLLAAFFVGFAAELAIYRLLIALYMCEWPNTKCTYCKYKYEKNAATSCDGMESFLLCFWWLLCGWSRRFWRSWNFECRWRYSTSASCGRFIVASAARNCLSTHRFSPSLAL